MFDVFPRKVNYLNWPDALKFLANFDATIKYLNEIIPLKRKPLMINNSLVSSPFLDYDNIKEFDILIKDFSKELANNKFNKVLDSEILVKYKNCKEEIVKCLEFFNSNLDLFEIDTSFLPNSFRYANKRSSFLPSSFRNKTNWYSLIYNRLQFTLNIIEKELDLIEINKVKEYPEKVPDILEINNVQEYPKNGIFERSGKKTSIIENIEKRKKDLSIRQIALICQYQNRPVTESLAEKVLIEFEKTLSKTTGQQLADDCRQFNTPNQRTAKNVRTVNDIKTILPFLSENERRNAEKELKRAKNNQSKNNKDK